MDRGAKTAWLLLTAMLSTAVSCSSTEETPPAATTSTSPAARSYAAASGDQADVVVDETPPRPKFSSSGLVTDGMIGQVNGRPIYVNEVLEPLDEMLIAMGGQHTPEVFRRRLVAPLADGTRIVPDRLWSIVMNALILAEAERDLTEQEQSSLRNILKEKREELLRKSLGSISRANARSRKLYGHTLGEQIEEQRKALVVNRYVHQKLWPKVHVSRRKIEHYYKKHPDEFNEKSARRLRMIRTDNDAHAATIDQRLGAGESFVDVASSNLNQKNAEEGGMYEERFEGDKIFGIDALNDPVLALAEGEHSTRITLGSRHVWLFLENVFPAKSTTLLEAQRHIEEKLRQQQYLKLFNEYRARLQDEGSYTPVDRMTQVTVDIATNLYADGTLVKADARP